MLGYVISVWLRCVIFSVAVVLLLSDMYLLIGLFPGGVGLVLGIDQKLLNHTTSQESD